MPKIIKNLESKLLEEARRQIQQSGYGAVTVRSVATACGVGVGTVYNYFSSKDELLAAYMLADWKDCVTAITAVGSYSDVPRPLVRCIYDQLLAYTQRHQTVFRDEAAYASFVGVSGRYHRLLCSQLAQPLRKFCQSDFAADSPRHSPTRKAGLARQPAMNFAFICSVSSNIFLPIA